MDNQKRMRLDYQLGYGTRQRTKRVRAAQPLTPIVTTAEFKAWAKIDDDTEDALIDSLLSAATQAAENYTRRSIYPSTWNTTINAFETVELHVVPVDLSTIAITYYDVDNIATPLLAEFYNVIDNGPDDFVCILFIGELPTLYDRADAVNISYAGGYAAGECPEGIRVGILKRAASDYENRQDAAPVPGIIGKYALIAQYSHSDWFPYRIFD